MKKPYTMDNSAVVERLQSYYRYEQAVRDYPVLDDVMTGACYLDLGGNTRPLSKKRVFFLLSTLPTLSVAAVEAATQYSNGHASKVVSVLRVISRALQNFWSQKAADEHSDLPVISIDGPPLLSRIRPSTCHRKRKPRAAAPHRAPARNATEAGQA